MQGPGDSWAIPFRPCAPCAVQILDVKKAIEQVKGADHFPHMQQKLIHQGKVLKDDTTLQENSVTESSFIVIMVVQVRHEARLHSAVDRAAATWHKA